MFDSNIVRQKDERATDDGLPRSRPSLSTMRDEEVVLEVRRFHTEHLPEVTYDRLLRAVMVAKNSRTYEDISNGRAHHVEGMVNLSEEEKTALREEHTSVLEPGMLVVILTVSLAAFLQGQVQSSINTASLFAEYLDIPIGTGLSDTKNNDVLIRPSQPTTGDFILGITNAAPFLAAAVAGCWMALPLSDRYGRKGSMRVAAMLVLITSLLMAVVPQIHTAIPRWQIILLLRVLNGLGMGIKAVTTPMLASESAARYWRGTSILAWQLWVACGIMIGFAFDAIFAQADDPKSTLMLVLGAPILPAFMLLLALSVCPESPQYYMRSRSPNYNPAKAYEVIKRLRRTELIALRDLFVLYTSLNESHEGLPKGHDIPDGISDQKRFISVSGFLNQWLELFRIRRLRNALISSSVVALAQQLCGINILAFYSGMLFHSFGNNILTSVGYSIGFGAINFIFGLPAIKNIDTIGRRKWLITTLMPMALLMGLASAAFLPSKGSDKLSSLTTLLAVVFLYCHAAVYSAGLGPVPFTLAAESFPLTHREVGCAFAISTNLFFAGVLSLLFPSLLHGITIPGSFALFAALSVVVFVLVFLLVEETKQRSLEDLDFVFGVPKTSFIKYQVFIYLPWLFKQYFPWVMLQYIPWYLSRYFPKMVKSWLVGRKASSNGTSDREAISRDRRPPMPRSKSLFDLVMDEDNVSIVWQ